MRLQSKTKMTLLLLFLGTGLAVVAVDEHNFEIFEDHQPKTVRHRCQITTDQQYFTIVIFNIKRTCGTC